MVEETASRPVGLGIEMTVRVRVKVRVKSGETEKESDRRYCEEVKLGLEKLIEYGEEGTERSLGRLSI